MEFPKDPYPKVPLEATELHHPGDTPSDTDSAESWTDALPVTDAYPNPADTEDVEPPEDTPAADAPYRETPYHPSETAEPSDTPSSHEPPPEPPEHGHDVADEESEPLPVFNLRQFENRPEPTTDAEREAREQDQILAAGLQSIQIEQLLSSHAPYAFTEIDQATGETITSLRMECETTDGRVTVYARRTTEPTTPYAYNEMEIRHQGREGDHVFHNYNGPESGMLLSRDSYDMRALTEDAAEGREVRAEPISQYPVSSQEIMHNSKLLEHLRPAIVTGIDLYRNALQAIADPLDETTEYISPTVGAELADLVTESIITGQATLETFDEQLQTGTIIQANTHEVQGVTLPSVMVNVYGPAAAPWCPPLPRNPEQPTPDNALFTLSTGFTTVEGRLYVQSTLTVVSPDNPGHAIAQEGSEWTLAPSHLLHDLRLALREPTPVRLNPDHTFSW